MKSMRVPLTYQPTSERIYWTVSREMCCDGARKPSPAWFYTDHDGYKRFGGSTWLQLVAAFSDTAENYAMAHRLS